MHIGHRADVREAKVEYVTVKHIPQLRVHQPRGLASQELPSDAVEALGGYGERFSPGETPCAQLTREAFNSDERELSCVSVKLIA